MPLRNRLQGRTAGDGLALMRKGGEARKAEQCGGNRGLKTYVVAMQLLLLIQLAIEFVDARAEAVGITTESDIQILEELVAACQ